MPPVDSPLHTVMAPFERFWYAGLALTRLLLTTSPGYLHPDEYHQSVEAAASLVGLQAQLPWEFEESGKA